MKNRQTIARLSKSVKLALAGSLVGLAIIIPLATSDSGASVSVSQFWTASDACGSSPYWCEPTGLSFDTTSNSLYLSDCDLFNIGKISMAGMLTSVMTRSDFAQLTESCYTTAHDGTVAFPIYQGIATAPASSFPSGATVLTTQPNQGLADALTYDSHGDLFWQWTSNKEVEEIAAGTSTPVQVSGALGAMASGMAVGPDGALYIAMNSEIDRLVPGNSSTMPTTYATDSANNLQGGLGLASDLAFASNGALFFAGINGVAEVAPNTGSVQTSATLIAPNSAFSGDTQPNLNGIAVDSQNNVYVADEGGQTFEGIYKITGAVPTPTTTTTTTTPTPTTTISPSSDVITPANGQPLELAPGTGAMINPNGTVTSLVLTQTSSDSIKLGDASIGMSLTGSSATNAQLTMLPGGNGTTSGYGFKPNSTVTIYAFSTPTKLGTAKVDSKGNFATSFPVPSTLAVGNHTIQVQGIGKDGKAIALLAGVHIGTTANTGSNTKSLVVVAAALVIVGGVVMLFGRRRVRR